MRAYVAEVFLLIPIEEVTVYLPVAVDIYGWPRTRSSSPWPYDLHLIRIQFCVRESNDAGSLKHQAIDTYARPDMCL